MCLLVLSSQVFRYGFSICFFFISSKTCSFDLSLPWLIGMEQESAIIQTDFSDSFSVILERILH